MSCERNVPRETDTTIVRSRRRIFFRLAVTLLLGAIAATFIQKRREFAVADLQARHSQAEVAARAKNPQGEVRETDEFDREMQRFIQRASHWEVMSLVTASLAVMSWGIAIYRHEKHRWSYVIVMLLFFVGLQLILV